MKHAYRDVKGSILKLCTDFVRDFNQFHPTTPIEFHNFEAHAQSTDFPEITAMGPMDISMEVDNGMFEATVGILFTTIEDPQLFKLDELCDTFVDMVLPGKHFTIYDIPTGAPKGPMTVMDGTQVSSVMGTKTQPARFIMFRAGIAGPPSPPGP